MRPTHALLAILLSTAFLSGCATPAVRQRHVHEPTPCTDTLYLQLRRQHPDSLTERAWQRLQSLDQACAAARRASEQKETPVMMGMAHGGAAGVAVVAGALVMVLLMIAFR